MASFSQKVKAGYKVVSADLIERLALVSDKALDDVYHYGLSKHGSFGWEANKGSAEAVLKLFKQGVKDVEKLADAVHKGWAGVAMSFSDPVYTTKPEKKAAREKLAKTSYSALPEDEKEKDRVVVRALLKELGD